MSALTQQHDRDCGLFQDHADRDREMRERQAAELHAWLRDWLASGGMVFECHAGMNNASSWTTERFQRWLGGRPCLNGVIQFEEGSPRADPDVIVGQLMRRWVKYQTAIAVPIGGIA